MENIYLDEPLPVEEIRSALGNIFRELTVFYFDFSENKPPGMDLTRSDHIFFDVVEHEEKKEFRWWLSVNRTPEIDVQERELVIGKYFSYVYGMRVLVSYSNPEEPDYPYCSIVFDNGTAYLADDFGTSFADGTEGLVQLLGPSQLPDFEFDEKANLIGISKSAPPL